MLTVIRGGGAGARPVAHLEALVTTTRAIERTLREGRINACHRIARRLTPIELGVVATRMLRDGFESQSVMEALVS
ncbi:hypothetical protein [Aromatoleum evansii]|jgi:hypothetical protein|uniref:hypothetical protein n=1 Tax=Aromatoleum evansii TaxID=59406 RepID=UPI00145ED7FF|nr:hypothetical protein [Aromatoleum evansii]NMG29535.1 hypothetical protein [Aromatoleum evansii]